VNLNSEQLHTLKQLYFEEYGVELCDEKLREEAFKLFSLYKLIYLKNHG